MSSEQKHKDFPLFYGGLLLGVFVLDVITAGSFIYDKFAHGEMKADPVLLVLLAGTHVFALITFIKDEKSK